MPAKTYTLRYTMTLLFKVARFKGKTTSGAGECSLASATAEGSYCERNNHYADLKRLAQLDDAH